VANQGASVTVHLDKGDYIIALESDEQNYYYDNDGIITIRITGEYQPGTTPSSGALSDEQLIAQAKQAVQGKPQPENYSSCLVYAQKRGLKASASGNPQTYGDGAFNILWQGNDAKLVNNVPTASLKSGIKPLQSISNLTTVLQPGDFIVCQRDVAGANKDYGHIAVVELVETGRVVISQANWSPAWKVLHTSDFVSGMYGYPSGLP